MNQLGFSLYIRRWRHTEKEYRESWVRQELGEKKGSRGKKRSLMVNHMEQT